MKLRAHHLLCMQNFTGHGYSAAFTAHMTALLQSLAAHPETVVRLVGGCDDLCAACPHNMGGVCDSAEKVVRLDAGVCAAAGLAADSSGTWAELTALARTSILQTAEFDAICAACEWYHLCKQLGEEYGKHSNSEENPND